MKKRRRKQRKTKFQLQLAALGFKTYAAYLKSDHWTSFKEAYFAKRKKVCYCCKEPARDLHHIDYSNLGGEKTTQVKPLCRSCHDKVHKIIKEHHVPLKTAHKVVQLLT